MTSNNRNTPAPQRQGQQQDQSLRVPQQVVRGEDVVVAMLRQNAKWIADMIGVKRSTDDGQSAIKRMFAMAIKAYRKGGPKMWECDPSSFFDAISEAASKGLSLDPALGECYLIPRKRSWKDPNGNWQKTPEVNFQPGYRGILKLARRSDELTKIKAVVVYEGDEFEHFEGTDDRLYHRPSRDEDPGGVVAAYAIAKVRGSDEVTFRVMYRRDLDATAAKSGDPRNDKFSDVWNEHYAEMAMKTVLKRLCKWLPVADDLKSTIIRDDIRDDGGDPGSFGSVTVDQPPAPRVQPARDLDGLVTQGAPPQLPPERGDVHDDGPPEDWEGHDRASNPENG